MAKGGGAKDKAAREDAARAAADARYEQWKRLLPVLYDSFTNHNLVWPSLSCRWGPRLEEFTFKGKQRAYLSEQTDGSVPNTLVVAQVELMRPHVADAEAMQSFNYKARSPYVKRHKTIIHPGEVNRIREYPEAQNIVATHSDSPKVYVWNVDSQPERAGDAKVVGSAASVPDLELTGHDQFAEFALAFHPKEPRLISGGRDGEVLLWHLEDQMTSLASAGTSTDPGSADGGAAGRKSVNSGGQDGEAPSSATKVAERARFQGHSNTIEDVVFRPSSADEFCSVGDDAALIFWDARQEGGKPAAKVEDAHGDDIHCVDWNGAEEHLVLTGGADHTVRLFDRRKLAASGAAAVVHTFAAHSAAILSVQWNPHRANVFASGGEDGLVMVWDAAAAGAHQNGAASAKQPSGLMFQHAGHRDKVVDFQWNAADPWTILSVSDDINFNDGGGTLQIWRMNDLVYLPEEEALGELKRHRDYITGKANRVPEKAPSTTPGEPAELEAEMETKEDAPTETTTELPTEPMTDAPMEPMEEAPAETKAEAPTKTVAEAPNETEAEVLSETKAEAPTETKAEAPAETKTEVPTETKAEASIETETEAPTKHEPEPNAEAKQGGAQQKGEAEKEAGAEPAVETAGEARVEPALEPVSDAMEAAELPEPAGQAGTEQGSHATAEESEQLEREPTAATELPAGSQRR